MSEVETTGGKVGDGTPRFSVGDITGQGGTSRSTRGYQSATYPFLKRHFGAEKLRWRVTAYRVWEGAPRDGGLEQHFTLDGFAGAKSYAAGLVREGTAVSASVDLDAEFPVFFFAKERNVGGWNVVVRDVYTAEAKR